MAKRKNDPRLRFKDESQKNRRWLKLTLVILLFISFLLISSHKAILTSAASFLIKEDPLKPSDLVVVLGGNWWERAREAVDIYKKGYAREVLIMKEIKPEGYDELLKLGIALQRPHEINKRVMMSLGVPEEVISVPEDEADSTYQEALIAREIIKKRKIKSIIIVTEKTHTKRACMTFHFLLGRDIRVICRPSGYDDFQVENWWQRRKDIKEVIFEYQKLMAYSLDFLRKRITD